MQDTNQRLLRWIPRILAVIFILFISLFALDVFGVYETLAETLLALFIHLIPTYIMIVATYIAWRWRLTGGVLFIGLGFFSVFFFKTYEDIITFLIVSLPAFVVGALFLWDGLINRPPTKPKQDTA